MAYQKQGEINSIILIVLFNVSVLVTAWIYFSMDEGNIFTFFVLLAAICLLMFIVFIIPMIIFSKPGNFNLEERKNQYINNYVKKRM